MSNKLHFYTKYSKEKIKISDKPFASGGEGAIYAIASPRTYSHLVAKIYYPEKRTKEREAKMQYLMQHPPITFRDNQAPSIGWVQDIVYNGKQFIGILLIKIEGKKLTKLTLFKLPRRADKAWQRFAFQQPDALKLRLRTCFNLAVVIHQIHESGQYVLVDLKPDNVLMQPNGLLAVVDMDSVEVLEDGKAIFSAPVATPEYTPPEHYDGPRGTIDETWDYFSLGVIFYRLLLGLHPFAASCHPPYENLVSIHDKIQEDLYVHHSQKQAFFKVIPPPHQQFAKMPLEIQELFQNCFEHGAREPFIRPSPADWCNVLADLLNLPFKKIPKVNIPPSNLYFSPTVALGALPLLIPDLPANQSILHLNSTDLALSPKVFPKKHLIEELKVAYKKYLHQDRERLLQTVLAGIILTILFFTYPVFFGLGLALLLILAPQLFLTKFQSSIDSVGKAIVSKSTYQLLKTDEDSTLEAATINSTSQLVRTLISKKEQALQQERAKLTNPQENKQTELAFIQRYLKKRENFEQKTTALTDWLARAESKISATRKEELEAYKIASEDFLAQLKKEATYAAYDFKSLAILRIKIHQEINTLKGSLSLLERPLKTLQLEHEKKVQKLKNTNYLQRVKEFRQNKEVVVLKELKLFKAENKFVYQHKEAYWDFIKEKKDLHDENHQQKQKIEHQLHKSLEQIRKDLGLNSKSELEFYIALLKNQPKALQLDFAPQEIQKQFDHFLKQIQTLNIDTTFSSGITELLTLSLQKVSFDTPQKAKNIRTLTNLQQNMTNTWEMNQTKLHEFDKALQKLVKSPEICQDPIELAYWSKAGKEQLTNIVFNLNQYSELQEVFYGDPIIFRLKNKLKTYDEEVLYANKEIQLLEKTYLAKIKRLEEENKDLIKNQNELEEIKAKQELLILEKEQALRKKVDKEVLFYENSFKQRQAKSIDAAIEVYEKELSVLQKQIKRNQLGLQGKLDKIEPVLKKLEQDYATFEEVTTSIRTKAELVYISKRSYLDELQQEANEIRKEHPEALQRIKENAVYYQELKVHLLEFKDNLKELDELQENKIRLDTLSEWQKGYDSRIYIKDLLLNKVEQFEQYEQKKK